MTQIHNILLIMHIIFGTCSLVLFWLPIASRKGGVLHRRSGRWFASSMYLVAISALLLAALDMMLPQQLHPDTAPQAVRGNALFLFTLGVLVLVTTRHGLLSIREGSARLALRRWPHRILCLSLAMAGLLLTWRGLSSGVWLWLIFGALQLWLSASFLHYSLKRQVAAGEWWIEHFAALISSGIAAYTAFLVFGGRGLLMLLPGGVGNLEILLWVAPGVAGGSGIAWLAMRYRRRFANTASEAEAGQHGA